jgi:hypothetical protein
MRALCASKTVFGQDVALHLSGLPQMGREEDNDTPLIPRPLNFPFEALGDVELDQLRHGNLLSDSTC